jgi:hypothetical protein
MNAGLTMLSDDELTRLRERIAKLAALTQPEETAVIAARLETIDIERERRLAQPLVAPQQH